MSRYEVTFRTAAGIGTAIVEARSASEARRIAARDTSARSTEVAGVRKIGDARKEDLS